MRKLVGEVIFQFITTDKAKVSFIMKVYVVYYESLKRELKTKTIDEYRCDERLIKLT